MIMTMTTDIEYFCWHEKPYGSGPYCTGCGGLIIKKNMTHSIVVKDRYSKQFSIGGKVAFNFCGNVAIGFITEIKEVERYGKKTDYNGKPYYVFHVRHQGSDRISKVTSPKNLVTI